mgnify:CR=1 FL=1
MDATEEALTDASGCGPAEDTGAVSLDRSLRLERRVDRGSPVSPLVVGKCSLDIPFRSDIGVYPSAIPSARRRSSSDTASPGVTVGARWQATTMPKAATGHQPDRLYHPEQSTLHRISVFRPIRAYMDERLRTGLRNNGPTLPWPWPMRTNRTVPATRPESQDPASQRLNSPERSLLTTASSL